MCVYSLADLLEEICLEKDFSDRLSNLMPKILILLIHQCSVIAPLARYKKSQKKRKKYWKNKINLVVRKSNSTKQSVYHYVIDWY